MDPLYLDILNDCSTKNIKSQKIIVHRNYGTFIPLGHTYSQEWYHAYSLIWKSWVWFLLILLFWFIAHSPCYDNISNDILIRWKHFVEIVQSYFLCQEHFPHEIGFLYIKNINSSSDWKPSAKTQDTLIINIHET